MDGGGVSESNWSVLSLSVFFSLYLSLTSHPLKGVLIKVQSNARKRFGVQKKIHTQSRIGCSRDGASSKTHTGQSVARVSHTVRYVITQIGKSSLSTKFIQVVMDSLKKTGISV